MAAACRVEIASNHTRIEIFAQGGEPGLRLELKVTHAYVVGHGITAMVIDWWSILSLQE